MSEANKQSRLTDLLNNEIVDPLGFNRVGDRLSNQYRQHNWHRIRQCVGKLEHDDGQRDGRSLQQRVGYSNVIKYLQMLFLLTVTPERVARRADHSIQPRNDAVLAIFAKRHKWNMSMFLLHILNADAEHSSKTCPNSQRRNKDSRW